MRVRRRRGVLRVELRAAEAALLASLFTELEQVLDEPDAVDPVVARLFPAAYADDTRAAEFRELTEASLRTERTGRLEQCRAELAFADAGEDGMVELADADAVRRWLQALNDVRLALGTRLGVTAEEPPEIDPTDPAQHPWVIYHWLTMVQDTLVTTADR